MKDNDLLFIPIVPIVPIVLLFLLFYCSSSSNQREVPMWAILIVDEVANEGYFNCGCYYSLNLL